MRTAVVPVPSAGEREKEYQMARKNRVSVYDGIYHITSRIANRAMLLAKDEVKDRFSSM